jgi:hypothetical protein
VFARLKHSGVVEVEQAIAAPERGTEHFVPMASVIHVAGSIVNSQVANASPGAQQSGTFDFNSGPSIGDFIDAARVLVKELNLGDAVAADLAADVSSMERELDRPEPRQGIIREFGRSVRNVLEQAMGGIVAATATPEIVKAIETISSYDW